MAIERTELELVWPADLFRQEGQALLAAGKDDESTLGWLLAEAFRGERGYRLFIQTQEPWKGWGDVRPIGAQAAAPHQGPTQRVELVTGLVRDTDELPRYVPKRYYSTRRNPPPDSSLTPAQTKTVYAEVIAGLSRTGYFHDAFGSVCVDDAENSAEQGQKQLSSLLDTDSPMWPLARDDEELTGVEQDWSEDLFFDVIEALHDLVARPRSRSWHEFDQHWDYQDFARAPGQAVYRWKVNEMLARSEIPLRLADAGNDRGRLVHAADDGRQDLVQRMLQSPDPDVREDVVHAIALFRSRTATTAERRSALFTLAGVFERRRALLRVELFKKDEGALFYIANEFDIRHRDKSQQNDYDPVFLDWLFWWYLATVELTDQLLARQMDERS